MHLADGKSLTGDEVLDLVPDFRLEEATAVLFGGERLGGYDLPFTEIDPRIIAIEYAELGQVLTGRNPPWKWTSNRACARWLWSMP